MMIFWMDAFAIILFGCVGFFLNGSLVHGTARGCTSVRVGRTSEFCLVVVSVVQTATCPR
jgi:hypothetical protein